MEQLSARISESVNTWLDPAANFMARYVWGWPSPDAPLLAFLLLFAGLYVTVRLAFIQIRGFRHAVNITRGKYDNPEDAGDLSHFQALTTALSATVGIGNIAGVAIAIRMGGPGALFWMWLTAFFGMALKYVECTLAMMHRRVHEDGSVSGGPMHYIELGLGSGWKWLALMFAGFAAVSSVGSGCMNQSNTLAVQVQSEWGVPVIWTALIFSALVAAVIIGGIRRIGRVTSVLAPTMAVLYVAGAMMILAVNIGEILPGLKLIVTQAFAPEPLVGGGVGSFMLTLMWGVRRGLFSNEAGQGSAPIAHATAKTKEPAREGLVASLGPFIDTLVICTMTGLVVITTGAFETKTEQRLALSAVSAVPAGNATDERLASLKSALAEAGERTIPVSDGHPSGATIFMLDSVMESARVVDEEGRGWSGSLTLAPDGSLAAPSIPAPSVEGKALLTAAAMTAEGFRLGLGGLGSLIVTLAVILFATSTGISWSYYGDRSVEYLFGPRAVPIYRWVFVFFFFMGCLLPLEAVWSFGDVALGLMTLPNLIAIFMLTGGVVKVTHDYMSREHKPYR